MKRMPLKIPSMRKPRREFCGLKRNSESFACGSVLLYGTLPKLLPRDPPAFLSFHVPVRSINPTGVMATLPIGICRGETGAALACGTAGCGAALGRGRGAAGSALEGAAIAGSVAASGVVLAVRLSVGYGRWFSAAPARVARRDCSGD